MLNISWYYNFASIISLWLICPVAPVVRSCFADLNLSAKTQQLLAKQRWNTRNTWNCWSFQFASLWSMFANKLASFMQLDANLVAMITCRSLGLSDGGLTTWCHHTEPNHGFFHLHQHLFDYKFVVAVKCYQMQVQHLPFIYWTSLWNDKNNTPAKWRTSKFKSTITIYREKLNNKAKDCS